MRFAEAVLLLITIIWGSSFVVANVALELGFSPLLALVCRFAIASGFMAVVYRKRLAERLRREDCAPGAALGVVFMLAFYTQMLGLKHSTPSNNAIITSANVVLVPVVWWFIAGRRPALSTFAACAVSLAGVAVISLDFAGGLRMRGGDAFSLVSAALFAGQIVMVGELSRRMDYIVLVFLEFAVASLSSLLLFVATDGDASALAAPGGWMPILFLGVVCTCVCFMLQAWAMRKVDSSRAAVIMSTEALFGSLLSVAVGMDAFNWRILAGGLLLMIAVILPELWKGGANREGRR